MKVVAISDVHVKFPHDEADKLLMSFLKHPEVQSADYVMLLGDIFDLMCGPHEAYLKKFHHLFTAMDDLIKQGKKLYYFEGNHDLHLKGLFQKFWPENGVEVRQDPLILNLDSKKYYFSHGDEHEVDNLSYQRYKKIIFSPPLRFFANHIMPLAVLDFVGERASKVSRKKGNRIFDAEKVKQRFRSGVNTTTNGQYDFVLGGHSHVKDLYVTPETNQCYINNGYALKTKTFVIIKEHEISFHSF